MSIEMFRDMVESQDALNELTIGEKWRYKLKNGDKLMDWDKAIRIELAEYEDSFDWKWWKSGQDNAANARMELIDVLHFAISRSLTDNIKTDFIKSLAKAYDGKFAGFSNVGDLYENSQNFYHKLFGLFHKNGMGLISIYTLYMQKNLLNIFRQKNGYAEGTYDKVFTSYHNNITYEGEDNDILVACSIGLEPLEGIKVFSEIYNKRKENDENL